MTGYPATLTNKSWQKNKGLLAKAKPTGIGEALTALEKAYAGSGFAVDPAKLGTETLDPILFGQKLDSYLKTLAAHAKKLDAASGEVGKRTTAAEKTFAKDKAVLTELGKLQHELVLFGKSIQPDGAITAARKKATLAAFAAHLRQDANYKTVMQSGGQAALSHGHVQTLLGQVKQLEQSKDIDQIAAMWGKNDGPARAVRTTPVLWDRIYRKAFPKLAESVFSGSAYDTYNQKLAWIDDVGNEQGGSATRKVRELAETMPMDKAIARFCLEYSNSLFKYQQFVQHLKKVETVLAKAAK